MARNFHRSEDYVGKTFSFWTIDRPDSERGHRHYWCTCKCGSVRSIRADALTGGTSTSCGCNAIAVKIARGNYNGGPSLVGAVFGGWTVVGEIAKGARHDRRWECRCECGGEGIVSGHALKIGRSTSCGCRKPGMVSAMRLRIPRKYGLAPKEELPPEYMVWVGMRQRCHKPKAQAYKYYGGRGIRVCDKWDKSFAAFMADMGPRPSPGHSIDRIDVNGNYEPGNCRWATMKEQGNNRRTSIYLTVDGETIPLNVASERSGISRGVISRRLLLGWDHREAMTRLPHKGKPPAAKGAGQRKQGKNNDLREVGTDPSVTRI